MMRKHIFRKIAWLLSLCMFVNMWNTAFVASATSETAKETVTILACSDFQAATGNDESARNVKNIISRVKKAGYESMDGFFAMGDYDFEYTETKEGIASLKGTVQEEYATLGNEDMFFVQGNHDIAGSEGLSTSGAHDTEDYGVYIIHEDEYPAGGGIEATVKTAADGLEDYLQDKTEQSYHKPIFVLSHVPLHYSMRTYRNGDGKYAQYIFEVMNRYGSLGQTIIYLYGHNHNSYGFDDYIGGSAVYLAKGDTIYISKTGNATAVPTENVLQFSYMNAGYIGYNYSENKGADRTLTMTVFEITDNVVKVERYSALGIHNMKTKGLWSDFAEETKEQYGASDSYLELTYGSPQLIGDSVADKGVQVISDGLEGLKVYESSSKKEDVHTAYIEYELETEGYTEGETALALVTLPSEAGFEENMPVFLKDKTGHLQCYKMIGLSFLYETDKLDDFSVMQFKTTYFSSAEKIIYRPVSSFSKDKNYVISSFNVEGDSQILKEGTGETISEIEKTVKVDTEGVFIDAADDSAVWKWVFAFNYGDTGCGYLVNQKTGRYLSGLGEVLSTVENTSNDGIYWKMSSGSSGLYSLDNYENRDNGTRYHVQYDTGFIANKTASSTKRVYIFEEAKGMSGDTYAISTNYGNVNVGANANALTGSQIIFQYEDGTRNIVDVTLGMLQNEQGESISTVQDGRFAGLKVYYDGILVSEKFDLQVCREEGPDFLEIDNYRSGNTYTYPTKNGMVFAGWYEDSQFKTPVATESTSGYAYAKFVNADILSVKAQLTVGTTSKSESANLRILTACDTRAYEEIGFDVEYDGQKNTYETSTVYESILATNKKEIARYQADDIFGKEASYIATTTISNIPKVKFSNEIIVTPHWITEDGTKVYGVERSLKVEDGIETNLVQITCSSGSLVQCDFLEPLKAGETVTFDIEISPTQLSAVWLLGDDSWNDEWHAREYPAWTGRKTITVSIPEDTDYFTIVVQFRPKENDYTGHVVKIYDLSHF